jgi:hypothetical protein
MKRERPIGFIQSAFQYLLNQPYPGWVKTDTLCAVFAISELRRVRNLDQRRHQVAECVKL